VWRRKREERVEGRWAVGERPQGVGGRMRRRKGRKETTKDRVEEERKREVDGVGDQSKDGR